jgi:hypothetical protein
VIQDFAVRLPLETYISEDGRVKTIGDIYIELDGYFFPEKNWYDFGENLLSWWTEEFTKLLNREETKVECGFMDGPVRFDLKFLKNNIWLIRCIREYSESEECEYEAEIDSMQASKALLEAIDKMLNFLKKNEMQKSFDFIDERKQRLIRAMQKISANAR